MMTLSNSEFLKLVKGKSEDKNLMYFLKGVPDPRNAKNRIHSLL